MLDNHSTAQKAMLYALAELEHQDDKKSASPEYLTGRNRLFYAIQHAELTEGSLPLVTDLLQFIKKEKETKLENYQERTKIYSEKIDKLKDYPDIYRWAEAFRHNLYLEIAQDKDKAHRKQYTLSNQYTIHSIRLMQILAQEIKEPKNDSLYFLANELNKEIQKERALIGPIGQDEQKAKQLQSINSLVIWTIDTLEKPLEEFAYPLNETEEAVFSSSLRTAIKKFKAHKNPHLVTAQASTLPILESHEMQNHLVQMHHFQIKSILELTDSELDDVINSLFPKLGSEKLTADEINLLHDLQARKNKLEDDKISEPSTSLDEKVRKGLIWALLSTILGLITATVRELIPIFSAAIGGILGLASGLGGFVIQAILTVLELIGLREKEEQAGTKSPFEKEHGKLRRNVGLTVLGLISVGIVFSLAKFIPLALIGVSAPIVIPVIFTILLALDLYKENHLLKQIQAEKRQNAVTLAAEKKALEQAILHASDKPVIKKLHTEALAIEKKIVIAKSFSKEDNSINELKSQLHQTFCSIQRELYKDPGVKKHSQAIYDIEHKNKQLSIKEKFINLKKSALKRGILGVALLGVAAVLAFAGFAGLVIGGPLTLGIAVSLVGLVILGYHLNKIRAYSNKESEQLKQLELDKEPLIERMDLVKKHYMETHQKYHLPINEKNETEIAESKRGHSKTHPMSPQSSGHDMFASMEHTLEGRVDSSLPPVSSNSTSPSNALGNEDPSKRVS